MPHEWCQPAALLLCNNDPSIQLRLLEQVQAGWVAADSMNLWIETQRAALERVVAQTDILFLNDAEALAYSGADTLEAAGAVLLTAGPRFVVIKRGAEGATLFHTSGSDAIPAHPAAQFVDPPGAGATFAGATCGWLAGRALHTENVIEALHHGSALASATVEGLGTTTLLALTAEEAARRRAAL